MRSSEEIQQHHRDLLTRRLSALLLLTIHASFASILAYHGRLWIEYLYVPVLDSKPLPEISTWAVGAWRWLLGNGVLASMMVLTCRARRVGSVWIIGVALVLDVAIVLACQYSFIFPFTSVHWPWEMSP